MARPFFSLGSPTQICRHIPAKLSVDWNTCPVSSSRDLRGGGAITGGNLQDEDFPPVTFPYSSTNSDQRDGRLAYATVDLGWTWRSEGIKLGFFGGYFYNSERVNAFGCTQTAGNPFICVPPISSSVLAITQDTTWNAVRVGFNGEWRFGGGWRAGLDLGMGPLGLAQCERHTLAAHLIQRAHARAWHQFFQCANRGTARLPVYQWHFRSASADDIGGSIAHLRKRSQADWGRTSTDDLIE